MAWEIRRIERLLQGALRDLGAVQADTYYARYTHTRDKLINDVVPHILVREPNLTDHGPDHLMNVLDNADRLLFGDLEEGQLQSRWRERITAPDLYVLCSAILFHDVGNVYGRGGHTKQIYPVYNWVHSDDPRFFQERFMVCEIAQAHGGKNAEGGVDTLLPVPVSANIQGHPVRPRDVAAVLRLADELAEGPQRTSQFILQSGRYSTESQIFHKYASVTDIGIDRGGGRLVLTYHPEVRLKTDTSQSGSAVDEACTLAGYVLQRVTKLDEERQYTRFYSSWLEPFKQTSVHLTFYMDGIPKYTITCQLTDIRLPGIAGRELSEVDSRFSVNSIREKLSELMAAK